MARYEDARAGWGIFRSFNYGATMNEINSELTGQGLSPIANRTYRHYLKLKRCGYTKYIPINQLDVKTLKDPLWDQAVRNRYPSIKDYVPVEVAAQIGGKPRAFSGTAVETSPSMVICRFSHPEDIAFLRRPTVQRAIRRERVTVHFPLSKESFVATMQGINIAATEQFVLVTFGFLTLAAIEAMTQRSVLATSELRVTFVPKSNQTAFPEVARKFYWLFQASEAAKLVCEEFLAQLDVDKRYVLPSTQIKYVRMQSPLVIVVKAAIPLVALILLQARLWGNLTSPGSQGDKRTEPPDNAAGKTEEHLSQVFRILERTVSEQPATPTPLEIPERVHELYARQFRPALDELIDHAAGQIVIDEGSDAGQGGL